MNLKIVKSKPMEIACYNAHHINAYSNRNSFILKHLQNRIVYTKVRGSLLSLVFDSAIRLTVYCIYSFLINS